MLLWELEVSQKKANSMNSNDMVLHVFHRYLVADDGTRRLLLTIAFCSSMCGACMFRMLTIARFKNVGDGNESRLDLQKMQGCG
jgi:hypothetical protein